MSDIKFVLNIRANEGYNADQVESFTTVGDLKSLLEGYDDDVEVITHNLNNQYGANYGVVVDTEEA